MILSILRILEHWLQIQSIRARWELERDIEYYIQGCEEEIRKARRDGDDARADRVRHKLLRSSGIVLPRQPDFAAPTRADAPSGDH
jgi:hypothetical protein